MDAERAMANEPPKKPSSNAYWLWLAENRAGLQPTAGAPNPTVVCKLASKIWRELAAPQKQVFEERVARLKEQYGRDLAAYQAKGRGNKRKAQEAPDNEAAPKEPLNSYLCWLADNREDLIKEAGGRSIAAVSKLGGQKWKLLQPSEKEPYEKRAAEQKAV